MKIIINAPTDRVTDAAQAAVFALGSERPSDGLAIIAKGPATYSVRWNRASITVAALPGEGETK